MQTQKTFKINNFDLIRLIVAMEVAIDSCNGSCYYSFN